MAEESLFRRRLQQAKQAEDADSAAAAGAAGGGSKQDKANRRQQANLKSQVDALKKKADKLKEELEAAIKAKNKLREARDKATQFGQVLQRKNELLERDVQKLQENKASLEQRVAALQDDIAKQHKDLTAQLTALQQKAEQDRNALNAAIASQKDRWDELHKSHQELNQQQRAANLHIIERMEAEAELQRQIVEEKKRFDEAQTAHQEAVKQLEETIRGLHGKVKEAWEKCEDWKRKYKEVYHAAEKQASRLTARLRGVIKVKDLYQEQSRGYRKLLMVVAVKMYIKSYRLRKEVYKVHAQLSSMVAERQVEMMAGANQLSQKLIKDKVAEAHRIKRRHLELMQQSRAPVAVIVASLDEEVNQLTGPVEHMHKEIVRLTALSDSFFARNIQLSNKITQLKEKLQQRKQRPCAESSTQTSTQDFDMIVDASATLDGPSDTSTTPRTRRRPTARNSSVMFFQREQRVGSSKRIAGQHPRSTVGSDSDHLPASPLTMSEQHLIAAASETMRPSTAAASFSSPTHPAGSGGGSSGSGSGTGFGHRPHPPPSRAGARVIASLPTSPSAPLPPPPRPPVTPPTPVTSRVGYSAFPHVTPPPSSSPTAAAAAASVISLSSSSSGHVSVSGSVSGLGGLSSSSSSAATGFDPSVSIGLFSPQQQPPPPQPAAAAVRRSGSAGPTVHFATAPVIMGPPAGRYSTSAGGGDWSGSVTAR